jgi:adenine deaminase
MAREVKPRSGAHLKKIMELDGGVIICQLCDAHMWVEFDINGQATLMRMGEIPHGICPVCTDIHTAAGS